MRHVAPVQVLKDGFALIAEGVNVPEIQKKRKPKAPSIYITIGQLAEHARILLNREDTAGSGSRISELCDQALRAPELRNSKSEPEEESSE